MHAAAHMKRVLLWLIAINGCGLVAAAGHALIGPGPVRFGVPSGLLFFAIPLLVATIFSYPLQRSVRRLTDNARRSWWTALLCTAPALAGIVGLGLSHFYVKDQVISGWQWFMYIHLGYAGVLLLCVSTVHCSAALFKQHFSHLENPVVAWTDVVVLMLFLCWLPTFLCYLGSLAIFQYLYPLMIVVTGLHFDSLHRTIATDLKGRAGSDTGQSVD